MSSPQRHSQGVRLNRRWSLDTLSSPSDNPNPNSVEGVTVIGGGGNKEGYLSDLRRQHQMSQSSMRDEEYPYMLTEHHMVGGSGSSGSTTILKSSASMAPQQQLSPKLLRARYNQSSNRTRSGSMDLGKYATHHHHHHHHHHPHRPRPVLSGLSPCTRPGPGFSFSSSVDISVVPEDNEIGNPPIQEGSSEAPGICKGPSPASLSPCSTPSPSPPPTKRSSMDNTSNKSKAFLRQRSSSLPRILPPIWDSEGPASPRQGGSDLESGTSRHTANSLQSNLVIREMQKFVCSHAMDVSDLLPLPIPTHSRQGKALRLESERPNSGSHEHALLVLRTLSKVHGIMWAIKQSTPSLYSEFITTLGVKDRPVLNEQDVEKIRSCLHKHKIRISAAGDDNDSLEHALTSLTSSLAIPYSIIVHGEVQRDKMGFKYNDDDADNPKPVSAKFPGLVCSFVGSPLMDLYQYVHSQLLGGGSQKEHRAFADSVPHLLKHYHEHFEKTCRCLRISTHTLSLDQLREDFVANLRTGVVLTDYRYQKATADDNDEGDDDGDCLSAACVRLFTDTDQMQVLRTMEAMQIEKEKQ